MSRSVLIHGGTVVNSNGAVQADIVIEGGVIAAVLAPESDTARAAREGDLARHDASDCYVVPGGVDVHVHLQLPMSPDATSSDTFESGTRAAAIGGTTTILDFAGQQFGSQVPGALEERLAEAEGNCCIDYGLHLSMGDVNEQSIKDLRSVIDEGVTSVKLFMAYPGAWYSDDGQILRVMQTAAETGALVMMHAENGIAIDVLRDQAVQQGRTSPVWHGRTRPAELEDEATHRAIQLAAVAGAPLYIVHLSAAEALAQVTAARDKGRNVFAETCPQYLYLSLEEHLDQPDINGVRHICSPPLRSRAEGHHDSLWKGLRSDDLSVVSTDHCPFCDAEKRLGIDDFRQVPNGLGSIEHRMDLLYQGVVAGQITLPRWVELCSTTPARLFGLAGRKGIIAPGADADVVVYDPEASHVISASSHHMNLDHSVWEGFAVTGQVRTVFSRGQEIVANGQFQGRAGHGTFLRRGLPEPLR